MTWKKLHVVLFKKKKLNLSPASPAYRQAPPQPLTGSCGHFSVLDWWWRAVSCSLPHRFSGCGCKQRHHLRANLPDHWQPSDCGRPSPRHQTATPRTQQDCHTQRARRTGRYGTCVSSISAGIRVLASVHMQ